jgi:hypothetical protein
MITTIYHASAHGSPELADMLGRDAAVMSEFEIEVQGIRGPAVASGSSNYDVWDEWAEFHDYQAAVKFEKALRKILARFEAKAREWHAQQGED